MRSFTTTRMTVPLRSLKAARALLEKTAQKYGHILRLRLVGKSLVVEGEGVQNYRIRDWILQNAGA